MSHERIPHVYLHCTKEAVPTAGIKFLDIEEDPTGRDLVTYVCPECGEEHKSYVVVK
jgi:hypothetical protein